MAFEFCPCEIGYWSGRYGRIVGSGTSFHIRDCDGELWLMLDRRTDDETARCLAKDSSGVRDLIKAVSNGKKFLGSGGGGGGSFIINEYSQVIVPSSSGNGERVIVGEIDGRLLFDNPLEDGNDIDISDFSELECGDLWELPYVGVAYNLSMNSKIYYKRKEGGSGGRKKSRKRRRGSIPYAVDMAIERELPPVQDIELITNLRKVRNTGGTRFIVNPYGIVLTKRPIGSYTKTIKGPYWRNDQIWEPVFIGHVNFEQWFVKEAA